LSRYREPVKRPISELVGKIQEHDALIAISVGAIQRRGISTPPPAKAGRWPQSWVPGRSSNPFRIMSKKRLTGGFIGGRMDDALWTEVFRLGFVMVPIVLVGLYIWMIRS
jgi:hypothetical protein